MMLALSRTAGYAILALSCLDEAAEQWIQLKDIVGRVNVPRPYLAKILHALAKRGVVRAKRGYRGGFILVRNAQQVSIAEIVDAIEGENWLGGCMLGFTQCTDDRACPAHVLCKSERGKVRAFLEKLTLREVAKFERRHGAIPDLAVQRGATPAYDAGREGATRTAGLPRNGKPKRVGRKRNQ